MTIYDLEVLLEILLRATLYFENSISRSYIYSVRFLVSGHKRLGEFPPKFAGPLMATQKQPHGVPLCLITTTTTLSRIGYSMVYHCV